MEKKEMKGGVLIECLLMNIFPTGCLHRQGWGEGGQPNGDSCRGGEGGQKSLKMCRHLLWMAPRLKMVD